MGPKVMSAQKHPDACNVMLLFVKDRKNDTTVVFVCLFYMLILYTLLSSRTFYENGLESKSTKDGGDGKAETSVDTAGTGSDNGRADDGGRGADNATGSDSSADGNGGSAGNGRSAVDGGSGAGADGDGTSLGGGGRDNRSLLGLSDERNAGGSRNDGDIISGAGEVDLGHGHGGVDDDGGAGAGDGRASLVGAGNNGGDINSNGGDDGSNRSRGGSGGDVGGNASSNTGVGDDIRSADTLEEGDGLRDDGLRLAVGVDALVDVLNEESVGAVALSIGVVSAASLEQEGVQARGNDTRARERLNRGGLDGSSAGSGVDGGSGRASNSGGGNNDTSAALNSRRDGSGRLDGSGRRGRAGRSRDDITNGGRDDNLAGTLGAGNRGSGGGGRDHSGKSLSDRADGGRGGNGDHGGSDAVSRAVGDSRSAAGDGLDLSDEDGRGAVEAGDDGAGDGRSRDNIGDGSAGSLGRNALSGSSLNGRTLDRDARNGGALNRGALGGSRAGAGLSRDRLNRDTLSRSAGDLGGSGAGLAGRDALSRSTGRGDRSSGRGGGLGGNAGDAGSGGGSGGRNALGLGLGLAGLGLGRDSALLGAAVERDGADDDTAAGLGLLGLRRVDDGDVGSTTALLVHDVGTTLGALVTVLASRAIGHIIVELEIAVELGRNVDRAERELVFAAERRGLALVRAADTADTLASTLSKATTKASTRGPAVEVEVLVLREGTSREIVESKAGFLLVGTLVIGVLRASECRGVVEGEL